MEQRLNYWKADPDLLNTVLDVKKALERSDLDPRIRHLVNLRASQINGCGYCVDMHTKEARADGESEQRLHLVATWRESPLFSERERAALAWTERLTRIAEEEVDDDLYRHMLTHFSERELVQMTVAIGLINTWNRIAVPFRSVHPVDSEENRAA